MKKSLLFTFFLICGIAVNAQLIQDSIVFYMPFENSFADSSKNEWVFTRDYGDAPTYETGKFGEHCVLLDSMRFVTNDASIFNPYNTHTLAAWIKLKEYSAGQYKNYVFVHQMDDGSGGKGRVHLEVLGFDKVDGITYPADFSSFTGGDTDGNHRTKSLDTIKLDRWYHVASVFDRENVIKYLYVDGEKMDSVAITSTENCTGEFIIGALKGNSNYARGCMDDFLLVKQALDQAAIQDIMTNGVRAQISSVKQGVNINPVSIVPNPSNGEFKVMYDASNGLASYQVYGISGQVVSEGTLNGNNTIDLKGLNPGLYLFKYNVNGTSKVEKIIIK
ncbi:MAG: T9SS type A sorting domain-containing protein [Bacteroidales bacterium]|nr:T9SS type A sorting domain-containing protein [Bacteroidales bacterium]